MFVAVGVATALFGSGMAFRVVIAPVGAVAGVLLGPNIAALTHFKSGQCSLAAAGALGLAGALYPPILVFGVCGGLGGLVGSIFSGPDDFWLGFIVGFMVLGSSSLFALRVVESGVSGLVGGILMMWGAMRLLSLTKTFVGMPSLAFGAVGIAALAGMIFQLKIRRTPELAATHKARRTEEKRKKKEDAERLARFRAYSKKGRVKKEAEDED